MIFVSSQIKSLRLKSSAAARATRIPKLPAKPCKAGTNVVVKAKVLQEVPEGKNPGQAALDRLRLFVCCLTRPVSFTAQCQAGPARGLAICITSKYLRLSRVKSLRTAVQSR